MDPAQRTRWIQLGVLSVVLVAVVYFVLLPSLADAGRPGRPAAGDRRARGRASRRRRARSTSGSTRSARPVAADGRRPAPRRNPFRMGAATPAPAPEGTVGGCGCRRSR